MALEEQRQAAIITYVNLMRIKALETGENKELEYQIQIAKIVLQNFGLDYSELEYEKQSWNRPWAYRQQELADTRGHQSLFEVPPTLYAPLSQSHFDTGS